METSEATDKIIPALIKAQKSITNPELKSKVDYNGKNGRKTEFRYADLAACLAAVKRPLLDNDITLFQDFARNEGGIAVTTTLCHSSGQWVASSPLPMPVNAADPQGVGSAFTYGKRYTLTALLGIVGEDQPPEPDHLVIDDDGKKAKAAPAPKRAQKPSKGEVDVPGEIAKSDTLKALTALYGVLTDEEKAAHKAEFSARRKELEGEVA